MIIRNIILASFFVAAGAAVSRAQESQAAQEQERYMNMDRAEYRQLLQDQGKSDEQIEKALASYDKNKELQKKKKQKQAMNKGQDGAGGKEMAGQRLQNKEQARGQKREMNKEQATEQRKDMDREQNMEQSRDQAQEQKQLKNRGSAREQSRKGGEKGSGAAEQDRKLTAANEDLSGQGEKGRGAGEQNMNGEQRRQMEQARSLLKDLPAEERAQAQKMLDAAEKAMRNGDTAQEQQKEQLRSGQGGSNGPETGGQQAGKHAQAQTRTQTQTQTQAQTQTQTRAGAQTGGGADRGSGGGKGR